jgi:hypothetical protein
MDREPCGIGRIPFTALFAAMACSALPAMAQVGNGCYPIVSDVGYESESLQHETYLEPVGCAATTCTTAQSGCCDNGACCDNCDLCGCDPCCGPWTARVGGVIVRRERLDDVPLLLDNFGGGPTALNANEYQFDYEAGVDASLIFDTPALPAAIEGRFLWIDDYVATRNLTGYNSLAVNTMPNTGLFVNNLETRYRSELQSIEINFRRDLWLDCVTLLGGFRYIDFNERLDLGPDNNWTTRNDLFGFQLGGEAILYEHCCGLRIESFGKAGVYGNNARVGVMLQAVEEEPVSETNGMDHVAFFGEAGLWASYEFHTCWRVRGGYQVMWLDGVLVAANQAPMTDNNGIVQAFAYRDVVYHGAMFMLEANW